MKTGKYFFAFHCQIRAGLRVNILLIQSAPQLPIFRIQMILNGQYYGRKREYRVEEKYASATVHYKTITFWEPPFMNSNFGSYQK